MVWYESEIVVERKNREMADNAALTYSAMAAIKAPKQDVGKQFHKTLTELRNGE